MPKQYRLTIRGSQREDIDEDLLAQALLMVAEDLGAERQEHEAGSQQVDTDEDGQ